MTAAFWLVLAAGISDAVDGIIAKTFNQVTVLGGYLDPIADKTLLVCTYIAMGYVGYIPMWLVLAVVFRDFVIVSGAISFHTMTNELTMQPIMTSKVNTVAQLALAVEILASEGLGFEFGIFREVMIIVVAVTTVVSGAVYVVVWSRKASAIEDESSRQIGDKE